MSPDPLTDAESVPLGLLRRYLTLKGWRAGTVGRTTPAVPIAQNQVVLARILQARSGGRRNFDLYVLSENGMDDVEVILPRDPTASDFLSRIEGVIRTLSDIEGRDPEQIVADIRMIGYDVVRSSIPNMLVHDDSIHLEVATNYVTGVRDLLAATATTELEPQPFFLRVKKEAKDYADRCRFAHTFRGSFGFTIESPILPNYEPVFLGLDQPAPFERKVIARLARGIRAICEAARASDPQRLTTMAADGFSANACELFADLVEDTSPSGIEFSFSFSPEWAVPTELVAVRPFSVATPHVEMARTAAKLMRSEFVPRPERIVGKVIRLESDANPSDLLNPTGDRDITVQWDSDDLGKIDVKMSLGPEDYLRAVDAHKSGRQVVVSGTLERPKRSWFLIDPTGLLVS